jgi:predicted nucleotidyltransferase
MAGGMHGPLDCVAAAYGILAIYLFGSRADDGLLRLGGEVVAAAGSDLDVGVGFERHDFDAGRLGALQADLAGVLAPLHVDLVPLQRVDAIFEHHAIEGHRVFARDLTKADLYELEVMRKAADLLPIQRQIEIDTFGVSTT